MTQLLHASDANFQTEVLKADRPVLVDFWAEWCGPCKAIMPVLEEIALTYQAKLKVIKVNVDENHETASQYGIRSIPSLLLFKDGQVVSTKIGALTKSQLIAFIDSYL